MTREGVVAFDYEKYENIWDKSMRRYRWHKTKIMAVVLICLTITAILAIVWLNMNSV